MLVSDVHWDARVASSTSQTAIADALASVQSALLISPSDGRLWEQRGLLHARRYEWYQARYSLEVANTHVPLSAAARIGLFECYRQTGLGELARELALGLVNDPTVSCDLSLALAALLEQVDCLAQAAEVCQRAVKAKPAWAHAWFRLAYFLAKQDPSSDAVEHAARRAVELDPTRVNYRLGLACRLVTTGRVAEAYRWVSDLGIEDIQAVCCLRCLSHLESIYTQLDDHLRVEYCDRVRQRMVAAVTH